VPLIETDVPLVPIVGVKLLIVGVSDELTVNELLLDADPPGAVTEITPVVAPDGTVVTIRVALEELTVAVTPLKVTVF